MPAVNSVIIVGAGSAGWLTALSLSTYCPFLKVRLLRPRSGNPVGVGESTQGDFTRLLHAAGLDLSEFYKACDATLKCGIFYTDWNVIGEHYWHPFASVALGPQQLDFGANHTVAHHFQQMILRNPDQYSHKQYYKAVHPSYEPCVMRKQVSPKAAVAFHVDALKLTQFLERKLSSVEVLESDSVDVRVEDGKIACVVLDGEKTLDADLYVDCTGFNRAVIDRIAIPEILPYEANVNRAVAAQVPYVEGDEEATPYTGAHAHEHGWTWAIPLQSRFGSGYVYHSEFCNQEQAELNFRAYWGHERMKNVGVAHIPFDSATLRKPWVRNVVAIGLSAGFVEPLEATGLSWIITSASFLCQSISARHYDEEVSEKYNFELIGYIRDVQDFIDTHYKLSARRDSEFWKYQTSREYPERLENRLAVYAKEMPSSANRVKTTLWAFHEVSWIDILNGYEFKYEKLGIDPKHGAAAEKTLREIAAQSKPGVAPLKCQPPTRGRRP